MTDEEVKPFLGEPVSLVVPIRRLTSMSIWGRLNEFVNADGERSYHISDGSTAFSFPANDIHTINKSEMLGVVVTLE